MAAESDHSRYQEMFEHAPIARLITDRSGVVHEANAAAAAMFESRTQRLAGESLVDFVAADDREAFRRRLVEQPAERIPATWVSWLHPRGGQAFRAEVHVVAAVDPNVLHWAITDITERTAMEEEIRVLAADLESRVAERTLELEAERARLAAVVEQIPAGLMIVGPRGDMITANAEARRLLGDDLRAISGLPGLEEGRAELERSGGARIVVDVRVAPIAGAQDAGTIYLFQDVSGRERQERAERQFVTNAAHQLQSPLAGILSSVEVLQAGAKNGPERDDFLGHIERESIRLARLARALLILARAETGYEAPKEELVALEPLLTEIVSDLRPAAGVEIAVDCQRDLAVITNQELMEQAVINVAENAAKYTSRGRITLRAHRDGEAAVVVVNDSGPGIPAEEQPHVLDRFYRVERNGSDGFGLGFAIVRAALEALEGELELESQVEGGTVVRMRFPRAASLVTA